jgi:voltage-gated potassium channel
VYHFLLFSSNAHMTESLVRSILRRFTNSAIALATVLVIGTIGFHHIGGEDSGIVDALYFTFITIATIGYGEIFDLTGKPGARIFTMLIAFAGIGVTTYIFSTLTAFIVHGEMNKALRRSKMLKRIEKLSGHYIVCGVGRVGSNVAHELARTNRSYAIIDSNADQIDAHIERYSAVPYLVGDASEDELLIRAGVERAAGVFAVTGDDSRNLVITLTAKQLNPACRVVARCHEINFFSKMSKVGADAIVSPDFTGGMRIVSSMIRPHVVSFLDNMLRSEGDLRVEEIIVGADREPVSIAQAAPVHRDYVVLAVKAGEQTLFNPPVTHQLEPGHVLVVMASPGGRQALEAVLG